MIKLMTFDRNFLLHISSLDILFKFLYFIFLPTLFTCVLILFATYKYISKFPYCIHDVTLLIKSFDDENIFTYIIWEEFITVSVHPLLALEAMRANIVRCKGRMRGLREISLYRAVINAHRRISIKFFYANDTM